MSDHERTHGACVDGYLGWVADARGPECLVASFEQAFNALWLRARQTLGEVTLTAIVDRVLYTAVERFPFLVSLTVEATGIGGLAQHELARGIPQIQIANAVRFVLVELLTVLGNLTAQILSPSLHAELRKLESESESARGEREWHVGYQFSRSNVVKETQ